MVHDREKNELNAQTNIESINVSKLSEASSLDEAKHFTDCVDTMMKIPDQIKVRSSLARILTGSIDTPSSASEPDISDAALLSKLDEISSVLQVEDSILSLYMSVYSLHPQSTLNLKFSPKADQINHVKNEESRKSKDQRKITDNWQDQSLTIISPVIPDKCPKGYSSSLSLEAKTWSKRRYKRWQLSSSNQKEIKSIVNEIQAQRAEVEKEQGSIEAFMTKIESDFQEKRQALLLKWEEMNLKRRNKRTIKE